METYTFRSKKAGNFQFTVKIEFLTHCPDPEEKDDWDLFEKHAIFGYLHNTEGPALIDFQENPPIEDYFINGEFQDEEERNKIIYSKNFKKSFDDELHTPDPIVKAE